MSGRKTFVGGDILLASELNGFLMDQTVMVFDDSAARGSAIPSPSEGMVTYLKDTNLVEAFTGAAFEAVSQPGILQVVRATDSTNRTTTSTSFTDASFSVTITPLSASSTLFISYIVQGVAEGTADDAASTRPALDVQITDSSNVALSGAEQGRIQSKDANGNGRARGVIHIVGVVAAGSTSAQTFKARFRTVEGSGTFRLDNSTLTGQLIAMEVAA